MEQILYREGLHTVSNITLKVSVKWVSKQDRNDLIVHQGQKEIFTKLLKILLMRTEHMRIRTLRRVIKGTWRIDEAQSVHNQRRKIYEPLHEKTFLRGLRLGKTQTSLLRDRD